MISKNVPHTYIQDGIRYYALIRDVETTNQNSDKQKAVNFYMFDQDGYAWFHIVHTTHAFINELGNGVFLTRNVLEVDDTTWNTRPTVDSDTWIDDVPDRGYALEIVREGLGLNLTYLTQLMQEAQESGGE